MTTEKYACQDCGRWRPNTDGILDCTEHVNGAPQVIDCALVDPGEEPPGDRLGY